MTLMQIDSIELKNTHYTIYVAELYNLKLLESHRYELILKVYDGYFLWCNLYVRIKM